MNYLQATGLTKIYGHKVLFNDISLRINKSDKMALVAKNGTGKTNLLEILAGNESSDGEGKVLLHPEVNIGYLPQEPNLRGHTVLDAVFATDNPAIKAIQAYELALQKHTKMPTEATEEALNKAMEKVQLHEAWDYEAKIEEILGKFNIHDLEQPISELSGGERKRVALAALLIQEPNFLILDEPTNHLDLPMIEWLEDFLNVPRLTLFIVTHDRYFLNNVTNEIIELENGKLQAYRGNYQYYLEHKAALDESTQQSADKAKKLMKKELAWIKAQPKARTTKNKARIDNYDNIKAIADKHLQEDTLNFDAIQMARIGNKTVEMHYVNKSFGDQIILKDFNYTFKRRDRIGIVGKNGTGKSTFLQMLTQAEKPDSGKVIVGKTVRFGYYQQQGLQLTKDKKVIDIVREIAEYIPLAKGKHLTVDQLLTRFQFPHTKHDNYYSTLSGGEQRRLHLLSVLMKNPNFLILDEPTNDLDILTLNILEEFLIHYKGCLVVVSHDRYFMDKLIDHLFVFEGEGKVRDFPGNYTHYRQQQALEIAEKRLLKETINEDEATDFNNLDSQASSNSYANREKKLSYHEQREFEQIEKDIDELEEQKSQLTKQLSTENATTAQILEWGEKLQKVVNSIQEKEDRWMELSDKIS